MAEKVGATPTTFNLDISDRHAPYVDVRSVSFYEIKWYTTLLL